MKNDRTYSVKPHGKKFMTICRTDGFAVMRLLSKNTRLASKKGKEFVDGVRKSPRIVFYFKRP